MSDWKDLEIGNIPSDFFVNEGYEFIKYHGDDREEILDTKDIDDKINIIGYLERGYRVEYRLKPLKSIQINDLMFKTLMSYHGGVGLSKKERLDDLEERYNRKVEIIGDNE